MMTGAPACSASRRGTRDDAQLATGIAPAVLRRRKDLLPSTNAGEFTGLRVGSARRCVPALACGDLWGMVMRRRKHLGGGSERRVTLGMIGLCAGALALVALAAPASARDC